MVVTLTGTQVHRPRQSAGADGCERAELALRSFFSSKKSEFIVGHSGVLCVTYDIMARWRELGSLDVEDIEFMLNRSGRMLIRRSKTDQAGGGERGLSVAHHRWVVGVGERNFSFRLPKND